MSKTEKKAVVIVKGGPGTGKSVIALEVMGELLRQGQKVMHATDSSAFTNTLRKIVGVRAKNLFKFFNSFTSVEPNSFDVLVCDEAHRIRESSVNRYTPRAQRTGLPQIDELMQVAKLNIFFIDENQVVRPNEIGTVAMIESAAKRFGVHETDIAEFELNTQFRCSGSDAFLQWLDKILDIRTSDIAQFDSKMEFRIFDSPSEMMKEIRARNQEKKNSARIVAGFCWPWSEPNRDSTLVNDVKIGDFAMPWEKKDEFGIIFGKDLVYDQNQKEWVGQLKYSYDTMVTRNNSELTKHLKQVYKVLMSRAHRGVYVYFMDKDTETYFKENLKVSL